MAELQIVLGRYEDGGVVVEVQVSEDLIKGQVARGGIGAKIDELVRETFLALAQANPRAQTDRDLVRKALLSCFPWGSYGQVVEMPNQYHQLGTAEAWLRPWLQVTTLRGRFVVGWRSQVIVINWSDTDIAAEGEVIFQDQDVTTGRSYVHAWGYDKAREYIARLLAWQREGV